MFLAGKRLSPCSSETGKPGLFRIGRLSRFERIVSKLTLFVRIGKNLRGILSYDLFRRFRAWRSCMSFFGAGGRSRDDGAARR